MTLQEKYGLEIQGIQNELENIRDGNIYEITNQKGTPSYRTIYQRLVKKLNRLLTKIENNQDGDIEVVASYFNDDSADK